MLPELWTKCFWAEFRALKDKKVALPPAIVTLTGIGRAVPVYTDSELIDFKVGSVIACKARLASCTTECTKHRPGEH